MQFSTTAAALQVRIGGTTFNINIALGILVWIIL